MESLIRLAEIFGKDALTEKQIEYLDLIYSCPKELLSYQLWNYISEITGHPKSSVRYNTQQMRDKFELIKYGTNSNRGVPVKLTDLGLTLLTVLKQKGD